jgi:hypothetical protein
MLRILKSILTDLTPAHRPFDKTASMSMLS